MQELSDSIHNNVLDFEEYIQSNPRVNTELTALTNLNDRLADTIRTIQQNSVYNNGIFDYNARSIHLYNNLESLSNRVRTESNYFEQRLKNIEQEVGIRFPGMYQLQINRSNFLCNIASRIDGEQQDPKGELNFGTSSNGAQTLQRFGKKKRFRGISMSRTYQETPEERQSRFRRAHLRDILYQNSYIGRESRRMQQLHHEDTVLKSLYHGKAAKMLHKNARKNYPPRKS